MVNTKYSANFHTLEKFVKSIWRRRNATINYVKTGILRSVSGCRRTDCDYLHVTLARADGQSNIAQKYFLCAG